MARVKTCKQCKSKKPVDKMKVINISNFCDMNCAISYGIESSNKLKAKKDKVKFKARKEAVKPKSKWLSDLQSLVNKYVRLRDSNNGCISCDKDKYWNGQWHAGHYFSRGHSSSLRFNLNNIHRQCSVCNNHLSGNIGEYTPKLIDKIGQDKYDYLVEHKSDVANYDIDYIKRAIKVCRKAIKRIESLK